MTGQNVTENNAPALVQHNVTIETNIPDLKLTFHLVSSEQIDAYTDMGILFDLSVAFLGTALGAAIGFWTTLKQGGLSPESTATLKTAMTAAILFLLISIFGAIWFYSHKRNLKKQWRTLSQGDQ
jgi:predicted small integral membrane protein